MLYQVLEAEGPAAALAHTPPLRGGAHTVWNCDANELVGRVEAPIIYADPPYTKRQYSAYYHILETIARNDRPEIGGKTGLRNWKEHSSRYCYRRSAGKALEELLEREPYEAPRFILEPSVTDFYSFTPSSVRLEGYQAHALDQKIPVAV